MKAIILLANGFEECEALTPADVLRRAEVEVSLVAVGEELTVTGAHGIKVLADMMINDIDDTVPDVLILPGGLKGTEGLKESNQVKKLIENSANEGSYIAAICAAPSILGEMGYLDGRNIACYPGFEKYMELANRTGEKIEVDDIFITAEGMGVSLEFALKITELLLGSNVSSDIADKIRMA